MTGKRGASAPKPPSNNEEARDDSRIERESEGCDFHTSHAQCGSDGHRVTISGVRVELCETHLETARELDGVAGSAA